MLHTQYRRPGLSNLRQEDYQNIFLPYAKQPVPEMSAKEGYIPHGKLRTFTCGDLRSIGTLCPQVYASWKFFLCGRPQYFHMQVRSCPQRGPRTSADISADICGHLCGRLCGRPHGLMRTSAWIGAEFRMDGCGCLQKSAWMGADIRRARGSVRVAPPAV